MLQFSTGCTSFALTQFLDIKMEGGRVLMPPPLHQIETLEQLKLPTNYFWSLGTKIHTVSVYNKMSSTIVYKFSAELELQ